jgi:hypothetical protein
VVRNFVIVVLIVVFALALTGCCAPKIHVL